MNKKLLLLFTAASILYLSSCRKDSNEPLQTSDYANDGMTPDELTNMKAYGVPVRAYNSDVPEQWYNLQLSLIKVTKGFTPPVASRALGYTGLALYESMVNGMPGKKSLGTYLSITPALPVASGLYHWPSVANAALAEIERKLYNNTTDANNAIHLASIDALENSIKSTFQANPAIAPLIANSETYGRAVADAIFAWSSTDAIGHEGFLHNVDVSYIPITGPGMWVPTPPAYAPCVQPHWGSARPFNAADTTGICAAPAPYPYSTNPSSDYYKDALQVYNTSLSLTPAQSNIGLYWADGGGSFTPPGHWIAILTQYLHRHPGQGLNKAALAYAQLGMAVNDAFISCWRSKYIYCIERPITFIRANIDANWNSIIATPPFPEYVSGHSTQSGAACVVLSSLFGGNVHFTDSSKVADGFAPRYYQSFQQAAEEAAVSRLYGGIHFANANNTGIAVGGNIGANIVTLPWYK